MSVIPCKNFDQYQREKMRRNSGCPELWQLLDDVKDPEIPVLSLWDMGILKDIQRDKNKVIVLITPTYSGCPAMDVIREDIEAVLLANGISACEIKTELSPAWTTDWMTDEGRKQLRNFGIAPPSDVIKQGDEEGLFHDTQVKCPHCGSDNTRMVSEFGSTACKALFQCNQCNEPFDLFKKI